MRLLPVFFFMGFVVSLHAVEDFDRQQILERIQPLGQVRILKTKGDTTEPPAVTVKAPENKEPGQAIYESRCVVCHDNGVAGAPKFRDKDDWAPRIAKLSLQELVAVAIKGLNAMPPKGTCGECTENDIKTAIQYMLPRK